MAPPTTTTKPDTVVLITLFLSFFHERAPWIQVMQQWQLRWHDIWHFTQVRHGRQLMLVQLEQRASQLNQYVESSREVPHRNWTR